MRFLNRDHRSTRSNAVRYCLGDAGDVDAAVVDVVGRSGAIAVVAVVDDGGGCGGWHGDAGHGDELGCDGRSYCCCSFQQKRCPLPSRLPKDCLRSLPARV